MCKLASFCECSNRCIDTTLSNRLKDILSYDKFNAWIDSKPVGYVLGHQGTGPLVCYVRGALGDWPASVYVNMDSRTLYVSYRDGAHTHVDLPRWSATFMRAAEALMGRKCEVDTELAKIIMARVLP